MGRSREHPLLDIAQGRLGGADLGTGHALFLQYGMGAQGADLRRFG